MYPRQLEQLADQRRRELAETARARRAAASGHLPGKQARRHAARMRRQTGWALVSIGLRIAASGNR